MDHEQGHSGTQAAQIVGITYRQLDYWARTDLIRPSIADAKGSGTQRRYSYRDRVELKVIKNLLDAGVSLQLARKGIEYIRGNLGEDIGSASLVMNGPKSVLAHSDGEVIDLMRKGQGVLSIVALGPVVDELDSAIHELRPAGAAETATAPAKAASGGG